jgi:hypothetical protein
VTLVSRWTSGPRAALDVGASSVLGRSRRPQLLLHLRVRSSCRLASTKQGGRSRSAGGAGRGGAPGGGRCRVILEIALTGQTRPAVHPLAVLQSRRRDLSGTGHRCLLPGLVREASCRGAWPRTRSIGVTTGRVAHRRGVGRDELGKPRRPAVRQLPSRELAATYLDVVADRRRAGRHVG